MGATYDENESKNSPIEEIPLPVVVFSSEAPIVSQPTNQISQNEWMLKPEPVTNCPPGLEYLTLLDEIHIAHQTSHKFKYCVTNKQKEKIYQIQLTSLNKYVPGLQKFTAKIVDNYDKEIICVDHEYGCSTCFCFCFLQKIHAVSLMTTKIGSLEQEWNILYPTFSIKNDNNDVVFRIEGPCCQMECCSDIDFKIITPDGKKEVGRISKKLDSSTGNLAQKSNFGASFPLDLDVNIKAVILSTCILIDLIYLKTVPQ